MLRQFVIVNIKNYIISFCCALLFSTVVDSHILKIVQTFFVNTLSSIPLNIINILVVNLLTMIVILLGGLLHFNIATLFIILNGFALGIIYTLYINTPFQLFWLLFPHSIFEMILMILFCSLVNQLSLAYKTNQSQSHINFLWSKILFICIPLWLIAGILEGTSF